MWAFYIPQNLFLGRWGSEKFLSLLLTLYNKIERQDWEGMDTILHSKMKNELDHTKKQQTSNYKKFQKKLARKTSNLNDS